MDDVAKLDPLGRLAGDYIEVETVFELPAKDPQQPGVSERVGKALRCADR